MTSAQFCLDVGEQRRHIEVKLARNVLGSWRHVAESSIVLVEELVIETLAHDFTRPFFDLADVNEHSRRWIDRPSKDEIGHVITTASVARVRFRAKSAEVFSVAPLLNVQTARGGKFQPFANGEEHPERYTNAPLFLL